MSAQVVVRVHPVLKSMRVLLLAGVAAVALSACASNRSSMSQPDFAGQPAAQSQSTLGELAARYKKRPQDKVTIIYYAAALRAAGQPEQAVSVLEAGLTIYRDDIDLKIAYAKALTAAGRFDQATNVVDGAINPASRHRRIGTRFWSRAPFSTSKAATPRPALSMDRAY
jgi:Flp pilus assembly protein TadD